MSDKYPEHTAGSKAARENREAMQQKRQSELPPTAGSTTNKTMALAQDFCERTISDLNSGKATLRYETLEAFEKLCTQCGISTLRIQS